MSNLPNVVNPQRKLYASDMSDEDWKIIEPKFPAPKRFGRPRELDLRKIQLISISLFHQSRQKKNRMYSMNLANTLIDLAYQPCCKV
jgi:transposase